VEATAISSSEFATSIRSVETEKILVQFLLTIEWRNFGEVGEMENVCRRYTKLKSAILQFTSRTANHMLQRFLTDMSDTVASRHV